jgi:HPr kinase/phosphorylase
VLVLGASGSGKSTLCLDLLGRGGWLVADDAVELVRTRQALVGRCPRTIRGQIELRGLGLARLPTVDETRIDLVVRIDGSVTNERLPEPASTAILGVTLPLFYIRPRERMYAGSSVSAALARYIREVA